MRDAHYTPSPLAREMVEAARLRATETPKTIVDFAAGGGELLREAARLWAKARIIAADVDENAIRRLRRLHQEWTIGRCDFTNLRSRDGFFARYELTSAVDIVLLNPPFSCRGGRKHIAHIDDQEIRCSLALSFLIDSLPCLSDDGQVIAILPVGSLTSEKDADAWSVLRGQGQLETIRLNHHRTFPGTSLRTVVVRFGKMGSRRKSRTPRKVEIVRATAPRVEIVRGTVQMHTVNDGGSGWPLIHTTGLRSGRVQLGKKMIDRGRQVDPPCVFIPRVGRPSPDKVVLYTKRGRLGLSDCVIALKSDCEHDAEAVHATLLRDWDLLAECYVGSCAPYLTVGRLTDFLTSRGVHIGLDSQNVQRKEWTVAG